MLATHSTPASPVRQLHAAEAETLWIAALERCRAVAQAEDAAQKELHAAIAALDAAKKRFRFAQSEVDVLSEQLATFSKAAEVAHDALESASVSQCR